MNHKTIIKSLSDRLYFKLAHDRVFFGSKDESRPHVMLHWLLQGQEGRDYFAETYGTPPIIDHRSEYPIPGGSVDIVLFHEDASLTAIEIKAGGLALREIMTGVGQLIHATTQLSMGAARANIPAVRRCLAVFDSFNLATFQACETAGILYYPLGPSEWYDEQDERHRAQMLGEVH